MIPCPPRRASQTTAWASSLYSRWSTRLPERGPDGLPCSILTTVKRTACMALTRTCLFTLNISLAQTGVDSLLTRGQVTSTRFSTLRELLQEGRFILNPHLASDQTP